MSRLKPRFNKHSKKQEAVTYTEEKNQQTKWTQNGFQC